MGSPSEPSSAKRARRAEEQRQRQIQQTTRRVNQIFDSPERQAQYEDFVTAVRSHFTEDAGRQKVDADRNLKFSMARSGLTGGSAAVDSGRNLQDEYSRGILQAERRAQGSLADLRSADEQSRANLISMARSGADATTSARRAAEAMRSNVQGQRSDALAGGLGDIFTNTAKLHKRQREAAKERATYTAPVGSFYGEPFQGG